MDVLGLKKLTDLERYLERDALMKPEYFDLIERFPEKIDQLLTALNRVRLFLLNNSQTFRSQTLFRFMLINRLVCTTNFD